MTSPRAAAFLATAFLPLLGGCLLYTHEINGEPRVVIEAPSEQPNRGMEMAVVGRATDDEDPAEDLTIVWVLREGACPKEAGAAPPSEEGARTGATYPLIIRSFGPVCLFARATDAAGVSGPWTHKQFTGQNRGPNVKLMVTPTPDGDSVVPLYSRVVLTPDSVTDADGDLLKFTWQVSTPGGPLGEAQLKCPPGMPEHARCFVPRTRGAHTVQLVAEEILPAGIVPTGGNTRRITLEADKDRPPCLQLTDPAVYQNVVLIPSGSRRTFTVSSVRDDGEPYPGPGENGQPRFVWSIAGPGIVTPDGLERFSTPAPTFEVSEFLFHNPRPGDQFKVRVEVWDQAGLANIATDGLPCNIGEAVCKDRSPRDASDCVRWTTWTVQFHP